MAKTVKLACSCGTVKGQVDVVKGSYFHVHCLCCDCQNYAAHLKNEKHILDQHGASQWLQTYPSLVNITEGVEHIDMVQTSEKGIYRWHTTCCNMPVANTMQSASVPFAGVSIKMMQFKNEQEKLNTLGPVTMKAFGKYAKGLKPADVHERFPLSYMPKIITFMLKGMFMGKNKPSVFFKNKRPIRAPKLM